MEFVTIEPSVEMKKKMKEAVERKDWKEYQKLWDKAQQLADNLVVEGQIAEVQRSIEASNTSSKKYAEPVLMSEQDRKEEIEIAEACRLSLLSFIEVEEKGKEPVGPSWQ